MEVGGQWREESQKLDINTILTYMNAPLMDSFAGTKEVIVQFIINLYHNGELYFNTPIEINGDRIYNIMGLSNKREHVPIRLNLALVKELVGTPSGKNLRGLIVNQIIYGTWKITAKIVSMDLTSTRRGSDLKLNMLDAVQNVVTTGKLYYWAEHLIETIKHICIKFQKEGTQEEGT